MIIISNTATAMLTQRCSLMLVEEDGGFSGCCRYSVYEEWLRSAAPEENHQLTSRLSPGLQYNMLIHEFMKHLRSIKHSPSVCLQTWQVSLKVCSFQTRRSRIQLLCSTELQHTPCRDKTSTTSPLWPDTNSVEYYQSLFLLHYFYRIYRVSFFCLSIFDISLMVWQFESTLNSLAFPDEVRTSLTLISSRLNCVPDVETGNFKHDPVCCSLQRLWRNLMSVTSVSLLSAEVLQSKHN